MANLAAIDGFSAASGMEGLKSLSATLGGSFQRGAQMAEGCTAANNSLAGTAGRSIS